MNKNIFHCFSCTECYFTGSLYMQVSTYEGYVCRPNIMRTTACQPVSLSASQPAHPSIYVCMQTGIIYRRLCLQAGYRVWNSYTGNYVGFYLVGCNAMYSAENHLTSQQWIGGQHDSLKNPLSLNKMHTTLYSRKHDVTK